MRLKHRIAIIAVSVACGLALGACGQQAVSHVQASSTVRTALDGVFNAPTTKMVITAQGLSGAASLADGNFSIVLTTSKVAGASDLRWCSNNATDLSVYAATTDLIDFRVIDRPVCAEYFRVNFRAIADLAGPTAYSEISRALDQAAARPGLGYLNAILLGKWVGFTLKTFTASLQESMAAMSSAAVSVATLEKFLQNPKKLTPLRHTVGSSFTQSVQTWLSIHQNGSGEYSLTLPVQSFTGSLLAKLVKPVTAALKMKSVPQALTSEMIAKIPASLSLHANLWISQGSLTKLQFFIPRTSAYLMIGISHPNLTVEPPSGATMLTEGDIAAFFHAADTVEPSRSLPLPVSGV
jgi:hypothetical protein